MKVEAAITAPVFPALMNACELPSRCSSRPTWIEERRLLRRAWRGFSPMPMTSGASTISSRGDAHRWDAISRWSVSAGPTSWIATSSGMSASAAAAPETGDAGA